MSEQTISLTNKRKIPMSLPNGQGRKIDLAPGETQLVRGDFEYYRRMPGKGMNGLVVKLVQGRSRLVEAQKKLDEKAVRLVKVTNHRNIPMRLAVGIGQQTVTIGPKETSEPFLGRVSTIKQMSGITVHLVEDEGGGEAKDEKPVKIIVDEGSGEEPSTDEPSTDEKPADDPFGEKKPEVEGSGNLSNGAGAEAEAIAAQAAKDEAARRAEAEANDPLAKRRRDLTLPATAEEWVVHSRQLTWPDVRGIAKELGIKASNATKAELLEEITRKLYPEG